RTSRTFPLSLHDALPIWNAASHRGSRSRIFRLRASRRLGSDSARQAGSAPPFPLERADRPTGQLGIAHVPPDKRRAGERANTFRSEEHTSELQSRFDLVC